jgi:hypothetical protein
VTSTFSAVSWLPSTAPSSPLIICSPPLTAWRPMLLGAKLLPSSCSNCRSRRTSGDVGERVARDCCAPRGSRIDGRDERVGGDHLLERAERTHVVVGDGRVAGRRGSARCAAPAREVVVVDRLRRRAPVDDLGVRRGRCRRARRAASPCLDLGLGVGVAVGDGGDAERAPSASCPLNRSAAAAS